MRKSAFYNEPAGPKADTTTGYGIYDHSGLNPGKVPLPATNEEASTALAVGKKKPKKAGTKMKKEASDSLAKGFFEEMQKLGFGMAATPMPAMATGGVVTSKSKKSLGPKIRIVSSKSSKNY